MFQAQERAYLETARVGRLATADSQGNPHAVPVCFAFSDDHIVSPIDEKPKRVGPEALRRVQDVVENPPVALIVDHYTEDWSRLGWVQIRGRATLCPPGADPHSVGVEALEEAYDQYESHALAERPLIRIDPGSVRSWGRLQRPNDC